MTIRFLAKNPAGWSVTAQLEAFRFPGGELHLKNTEADEIPTGAVVYGAEADDLVLLGLWADYVHQKGLPAVAYIPYAPAARADRGTPFAAKVYAEIINSFNLEEVVIFDPHSPVIVELLNNVTVVDSARLLRLAVTGGSHPEAAADAGYVGVIAPDKGAVPRALQAARALHLPLYKATKERDFETGKLSHFTVEELPAEGRLLIVDDVADGGGTFLGLAEVTGIPRERLDLWVSHGIFSGKANLLKESFAHIYTTDSHPGAHREDVGAIVTPVLNYLITHK